MDCAEIRTDFAAGRTPAGAEVDEHVRGCLPCRELFEREAALGRRLGQTVLPEVEPGDLFAQVERGLAHETGLRARLRALSTPLRVSALGAVGLLLFFSQLVFRRRLDFLDYSPGVFWGVALVLVLALSLGATGVLRGLSAPLRASASQRLRALGLLFLPLPVLLVVPWGSNSPDAAASWGRPWLCFGYGAALVVPFLLAYWLLERRDRAPRSVLVAVGALAGIAANLLLHAHCPSAHWGHLLLGHATVGAAWALGLVALSGPLQRSR